MCILSFRALKTLCLILIFIASVTGCHKTTDEEQIKKILTSTIAAFEAGKVSEVSQYLHNDFRANGDMNAQQVKQMLMMAGMQHNSISVTVVSEKTRIDPVYTDTAETNLSIITTSSANGTLDNGSVRTVKLKWRKDSDWKILGADWQE